MGGEIVQSARIWVVDSHADRRNQLAGALQQRDSALQVAEWDAATALSLEDAEVDLVCLRLDSGADCAEQLAAVRSSVATRDAAVLLVAGPGEGDRAVQCLREGADDLVQEPISPHLLAARVRSLLRTRRLAREIGRLQGEKRELQRLADDLRLTILPLGKALSAERDFDRLLTRILLEAKRICNADAGTLYLRNGGFLDFAIVHTDSLGIALGGDSRSQIPFAPLPLYDAETGESNFSNVAAHAALHQHSINLADVYAAEGFDFSGTKRYDKQHNYRSVSCLTVPLLDHSEDVIGVLQLLNAQDPATGCIIPFDAYMQLVVESLASQAAVALSNRVLLERQKDLVKVERELEIGRQIQMDFLPSALPQLPGWEIAVRFRPARQVSGDFYDAFTLPNGQVCLVVADVCDKGVGAALFMALIRSLLRAFSEEVAFQGMSLLAGGQASSRGQRPPKGKVRQLDALLSDLRVLNTVLRTNDYVTRNHIQTNMFATMFLGVLDVHTGTLSYVNAGHNPPYVVNGAEIKARLLPTGAAVGMVPGADFAIRQVNLEAGDTLFAFTDGVTEARGDDEEFYGEERLHRILVGTSASAAELVDQVDAAVRAYVGGAEQSDDITMLALRRPFPPG